MGLPAACRTNAHSVRVQLARSFVWNRCTVLHEEHASVYLLFIWKPIRTHPLIFDMPR